MSQSVLDIIFRTSKTGTGDAEAAGSVKNMSTKYMELTAQLDMVSMGFGWLQKAYDATAGKTVEYANQVRELGFLTGMTAEESSRAIQVADDMKVSYDDLKTSLQFATRQGLDVTSEGLGELSDKYLTLNPGQEQAAFLMETFGKNGMVMAEYMGLGSAAIAELNLQVNENLILTGENTAAAREYEAQLDGLKDSVDGLAMQIGSALIPILSEAASTLNMLFGWSDKVKGAMEDQEETVAITSKSYGDYCSTIDASVKAAGFHIDAQGNLLDSNNRVQVANFRMTESQYDVNKALSEGATRSALAKEKQDELTQSDREMQYALEDLNPLLDEASEHLVNKGGDMGDSPIPITWDPDSDYGQPGCCFIGSTRIKTPFFSKRIDKVRAGEYVIAFDEKLGQFHKVMVKATMVTVRKDMMYLRITGASRLSLFGLFPGGNDLTGSPRSALADLRRGPRAARIVCSPNHPFLTQSGWCWADELKVGELVRTSYGWGQVQMMGAYPGEFKVFDLQVEEFESYVANGCVVHNKGVIIGGEGEPSPSGGFNPSGGVGGGINVTIYNSGAIRSDADIEALAMKVVAEIQRNG
jgi:hypothetical protein